MIRLELDLCSAPEVLRAFAALINTIANHNERDRARKDCEASLSALDVDANPVPSPPVPPQADAPVPVAPVAAPATDKTGRQWDERIDSSSKKLTDKGAWARRRGVDDAVYDSVLAELSGRSGNAEDAPALPPFVPAPPVPSPASTAAVPMPPTGQAIAPGFAGPAAVPGSVPMPPTVQAIAPGFAGPAAVPGSVPMPPTADAPVVTFMDFMRWATPHLTAGKLTAGAIITECAAAGCANMAGLAKQPELLPIVMAGLLPLVQS